MEHDPKSPKSFRYSTLIPFHYVDPAGILFFPNVFILANETLENFIVNELKIPWKKWFQNKEWVAPIKECNANYFKPIFAGSMSDIYLKVESISTSAVALQYDIFQGSQLCCQVKIIYVFCEKSTEGTLKKIPIPENIKSLLIY